MALYDYFGALRLGRRQYQAAVAKGEYPYLPVLDDILANADIVSEVSLGVLDLPLERIVGTKTQGRTQAFASNFMPLLGEKTEFASKWAQLYDYQITEGIQDPIVVYEFMNRYYVQEGNKRVSVLKYLQSYSILASVIRLIPRRSDDHDIRLYYEFLDFYQVSFNCNVWFSKEGSYDHLLELLGRKPGEVWDEEMRSYFKGAHDRFSRVFEERRTEELQLTASDALLLYIEIFGYEQIKQRTESQMRADLNRIWDELLLESRGGKIELVEQPLKPESSVPKLMNWLMPSTGIDAEQLKIAFIYAKDPEHSSWVYGHELGRMYLEEHYGGTLRTVAFSNAGNEATLASAINLALCAHCNVIFTTSPEMAVQSVKTAVEHPEIWVFNCSVNVSFTSICTYYARIYESKFLMGALAASMSESNKLGYIADYPIYGRVANINAFAMGARMINPRAQVYLTWSGLKDANCRQEMEREGISYVSGDDMITPNRASREFGLYHKLDDGTVENLATPICDWGKFYVRMVELICRGTQAPREMKGKKAINYWWGMSADVIDVIYTQNLPPDTQRLIRFLKKSICRGAFHPFEGRIDAQGDVVIGADDHTLTPEEIVRMDWLAGNVIGEIPEAELFAQDAQAMIRQQGVKTEEKKTEE
ncbi:MAG: BMP family ABC transporter substrate-binding protein [Lachnospiraceae bacterium]|nr:BMP family ABC transporter substrate-binding protein [Lachnospiraceae bacterium]